MVWFKKKKLELKTLRNEGEALEIQLRAAKQKKKQHDELLMIQRMNAQKKAELSRIQGELTPSLSQKVIKGAKQANATAQKYKPLMEKGRSTLATVGRKNDALNAFLTGVPSKKSKKAKKEDKDPLGYLLG